MAITHPVEELLTTADFARGVGVVPDTVRLWRRLGKVTPAFQTPAGICLYRRRDLDRAVEERSRHAESLEASA